MKIFVLLLLIGLAVSVPKMVDFEDEWKDWKVRYGKTYESESEEMRRMQIWFENYKKVFHHNNQKGSFTMEMNEFADMVRTPSHGCACSQDLMNFLKVTRV